MKKKLKEEQFERFKNVMDQFVSPKPEGRKAEADHRLLGDVGSLNDKIGK